MCGINEQNSEEGIEMVFQNLKIEVNAFLETTVQSRRRDS
jgi:hypothetical protein